MKTKQIPLFENMVLTEKTTREINPDRKLYASYADDAKELKRTWRTVINTRMRKEKAGTKTK